MKLKYLAILSLLAGFSAFSDDLHRPEFKHFGIAEIKKEHIDYIEKNLDKVIEIKPNKLGAHRILNNGQASFQSKKNIRAHSLEDELVRVKASSQDAKKMMSEPMAALPAQVNNSLLPSFPPIGDQGNQGSCVAFGSTYYQATHELGLLNGYNNKINSDHILSPKWTYNLLNDGTDGGLMPYDAFDLLHINGAPWMKDFPYDSNFLAWELDEKDWINATYNRMGEKVVLTGLGGSGGQNLAAIKQALNNGHILTFATYVNSWVYTKIKTDPQGINNDHVGEYAVRYMNGYSGGHYMTIVGYDDTLWIDINNNNSVDNNERGAFLVANSWGNWANDGFIWVSYDAFRSTTAVSSGPASGRVPLADAMNSLAIMVTPLSANYTPKLLGEFSLGQLIRNQIKVQAGVSDINTTTPSVTWTIPALLNQGGSYNFDGTKNNTVSNATFVIDLTDQIPSDLNQEKRYYLLCQDSTTGSSTTLNAFSLLDRLNNHTVSATSLPVSFDRTSVSKYLDYALDASTPVFNLPTVEITSPTDGSTISGTVQFNMNAAAEAGISKVELYCDDVLIGTDTTSPYQLFINTKSITNGIHTFTAKVTDSVDQTVQDSINLNVQNISFSSVYLNCGGAQVSFGSTSWISDLGKFTGASNTSTKNVSGLNPVYKTTREGNLNYNFSVPNGQYKVTLKFIENTFRARSKRVFDVSINSTKLITGLDVYRLVGYSKAYDRLFLVNVNNNQININLTSVVGNPMISGIQILKN